MTNKSKKISDLPSLSPASLDTTYVVGISGSTTYKISVNQLTSSLDNVFATDLAAAALSSSNAIMYQTASAASTWTFNHFLATKYPIVNVYDNNDNIIIPQSIVANNSSSLTITFSSPRTGTAVASKGGYVGSAVGNATTANALATGRLINNTLFDGTQNITIPNLVSGSTQISLAGTSDYTSLFGGIGASTASLNAFSASYNIWSSSVVTTGSNTFIGNQTITGSLNTSGSVIINGIVTASIFRATSTFSGNLSGFTNLTSNGGEIAISISQYRNDKNVTIVWGGTSGVNSIRDIGIRRNNTGSLEIYDGNTAGNYRDLILRDITGSNATFSGSVNITGSLFVSGTILQNGGGLAVQDGTILYHSSSNWFIPTSTVSNTGNIVTSVGTQFTSAMVGAKLTILRESRIITAFTSNTQVTVDSAYSQNYSSIASGSWGVYSKAFEIKTDSTIGYYDKTGGFVFGKRSDSNVLASNLLSNTSDSFYLLANSFALNKDFVLQWTNSTQSTGGSKDMGIRRNTTGSLEIYDGVTADGAIANRRDLIVRNITGSNALFSGSVNVTGSINISSGSITMPNRPAFRVYGAGGATSAITTLSGSMTTIDYNQGGWDNTTGTFTAPIAGLYQVNLVCRTNSNSGSAAQIVVFKNNTGGASGTAQVMIEWASNTSMNHTGGSTISKLAVGDTLKAVVSVGTLTFDANDNFSVAYIG
jgi:hypothetical protein